MSELHHQPTEQEALQRRMLQKMLHFTRVARAGGHGSASGGEKVAHRIATALHEIGDDLMLLDAHAVKGLQDLIGLLAGPFATDAEKIAAYNILEVSAGQEG